MPQLIILDDEASSIVYTIKLDFPPYSGDVEFDILPKTRRLVIECRERAKRNPIYNRHTRIIDGKRVVLDGKPEEAFVQELAKALVVGWRGVVDVHGNPVECNDETKIVLFNNVDIANWVVMRSGEVSVTEAELDEKNSAS